MKEQPNVTDSSRFIQADAKPSWSAPPEQWPGILKARALALAQPPLEQVAAREGIEVVIFMLAYETYGIETLWVREIQPLKELTPLPCTPAFVSGIINARGQVISVLDIKKFFGLPEGLTDLNRVIILANDHMEFGILADAVIDVRHIPLDKIQLGLPTLNGIRENYLKGISADRLVILDAVKLLTDDNIVVHEEII